MNDKKLMTEKHAKQILRGSLRPANPRSCAKAPRLHGSSSFQKGKEEEPCIDETLYPDTDAVSEKRYSKLYKYLCEKGHNIVEPRRICKSFQQSHGIAIRAFSYEVYEKPLDGFY